jgi:G3E family GTPase
MADAFPAFTPVNLLTGFLGSGKTTLLRRLLLDPALADAAVLINEFGEESLDHHLLERIDENMVILQSGCLCCTVRSELADAIRDLHSRRERGLIPPFNRVVIESTGLADPFPVLSTIKSEPVLRHHFRPSTVITTVDLVNAASQLAGYRESSRQIAVADCIVLTKADLADPEDREKTLSLVRQINPDAQIVTATEDEFDAKSMLEDEMSGRTAPVPSVSALHCHDAAAPISGIASPHTAGIRSFLLTTKEAVDWTAFGIWVSMLLNRHGDKVLRVKGILNVEGEELPVAIHGVQRLVHTPVHMSMWPSAGRESRIVFIVDGIDAELIIRSANAFNGLGVFGSLSKQAANV